MWQQKIAAAYRSIYGEDSLPDWLTETGWQKIELHKKSKLCRVVYQRQTVFSAEEVQRLEAVFAKLLPPGLHVELIRDEMMAAVAAENNAPTQKEAVGNKDVVLQDGLIVLYEKKPKAKLWLLSCDYTWTATDELRISFPSQVAKDTCEKLGIDVFLAAYLGDRLGKDYSVSLQFEQELQQSIMAAAEKREEKIIASALTAQKVSWGYSGPIYGKFIYDSPIAIAAVFDRDDFCVVRGEILAVTESSLKSGKTIYLLTIYDDTGFLPLKISAAKDKEFFPAYLVPGQWIKCRGKYGMDRFSGEVLFSVFDVEGISHPVWGSDLADEKRVELALHTKESSFDSIISVAQGVYTAAKWGQHGIGVADLHSVAAFPELGAVCREYGIKAIYGMELVVRSTETSIGNIIVWAKDQQGIAILYELLSLVFRQGAGTEAGIVYRDLCRILVEADGKSHVYCGLRGTNVTPNNWQSHWQDIIDCLLIGPEETKEMQQQQKVLLQWANQQGVPVLATDNGACCSERQGEIVRFLRENSGKIGKKTIRKITSTDNLLKVFYYLGEDMAKKLVVDMPEQLYRETETLSPVAGQALGYPSNEAFWQRILSVSKKKYDGVIPQEVMAQLEMERELLAEKGYYWLYPVLLELKEKYGGLYLQDNLLTSHVLGLSRENPLVHFIYCHGCGFSGTAEGFLCPNCGQPVQEFGMGTAKKEMDSTELQKISICGLPEDKENFWLDLSLLIKDCLLMAPGVYRRLSWESTEAMAELFLSGGEREELPGERKWFAAACQGMLLGVERDDTARLLIPSRENIHQFTPVLEAEGALYTYFPEEILSPFLLSLHYVVGEKQQLFWDIYRLLPAYRQIECMQARDWSKEAVWTMLKNHYWQGIPYLEQFGDCGEIGTVEDFARAVAHSIGEVSPESSNEEEARLQAEEETSVFEEGMPQKEVALLSIEHLLSLFGREIGFTWDICCMKAYSPEVFYVVALNNLADRSSFRDMWQEKTVPSGPLGQLIKEMKAQEIQVLPINVNMSETEKFILTEQGILASLDSTAAFDRALIGEIDFHRSQEKFSSQRDFFHRLNISPHLQHLFLTEHLLDELPEDSQTSLF